MATPRVSACVIAYNEEDRIAGCLESLSWVDEIIVVDADSTDGTAAICREHGARVVQHSFEGYVQQRNFAAGLAEGDWIISLDADERVTDALRGEILETLGTGKPARDAYSMPRLTQYLGRWIRHSGWYPGRKTRLWRRGTAEWGGRDPHARLVTDGPPGLLQGDILHHSCRDMADHFRKLDRYTTMAARERHAQGQRFHLLELLAGPPGRFLRHYVLQLGFLDGMAGLVLASMAAHYVLLRNVKLWEMCRRFPARPARERVAGQAAGAGSRG